MKITIVKQKRRSMALQLTPNGLRILIPNTLNKDDKQVKAFIEKSVNDLPNPPDLLEDPHSQDLINELVDRWSIKINVKIERIQIREMSTKWGSISTAGYLTLSNDLLWIPIDIVEYVIVHELMHLKFPNHAKGWKASMGMYLPDWKVREQKLKSYVLLRHREQ